MTTEEFETVYLEGFTNQLLMGIRAGTKTETIFKQHKHPKLLRVVQTTNNMDDLMYLRRDANSAKTQLNKLKTRMEKCEKLGYCEETKTYYKGIRRRYIDKGITPKDIDLYLQWIDDELKPAINEKVKEIKAKQK